MKRYFLRPLLSCVLVTMLSVAAGSTHALAQTMVDLGSGDAVGVSADGSRILVNIGGSALVQTASGATVGGMGSPYGYTRANAISADGSTIVGVVAGTMDRGCLWTAQTGTVVPGELFGAQLRAVSGDGSVAAGTFYSGQWFIWNAATGYVDLWDDSIPVGFSADGTRLVARSSGGPGGGYLFTLNLQGELVQTSQFGGGFEPYCISPDGSKVVGLTADGIALWTQSAGITVIRTPPAGESGAYPTGVSNDGAVIVGHTFAPSTSETGYHHEGFVWTPAGGTVGLGYLPGATWSEANGVSADGTIIVGSSGGHAFLIDLTPDPTDLIIALVKQVATLNLKRGIENSLDAKLDTALDALADTLASNDIAAVNSLYAFISAVKAQSGKAISTSDASALISSANKILALLL